MIFVVFAGCCIYNYMKRPVEAPEIIKFFDGNAVTLSDASAKTEEQEASISQSDKTEAAEEPVAPGLININTANRKELETLPGIGPVKAKAIIDYRSRYNGFVAIEAIMEVKGIGPVTYEKIKDLITIR